MHAACRLAWILSLLTLTGCAMKGPWPLARSEPPRTPEPSLLQPDDPTFSFVVKSDPSDAEVYQSTPKGERLVGRTPLILTLKLVREKGPGPFGLFGKGRWKAIIPAGMPLVVRDSQSYVTVQIPKLQLCKKGYSPETFTYQRLFPSDLKQHISAWKSVPIPRRYEETVMFRTPTQAQYSATVEIDSASGSADIHAVDAKGGMGARIGTTPMVCRVGYGRVRTALGEVADWVRWHDQGRDLFSHNREGDLLLNAYLVRDGYEPQRIQNRKLFSLKSDKVPEVKALLQLVRPNKPEAAFTLKVDSLPSDAAVYAVAEDGSLGRQISKTPFELLIGMAQESTEESPGRYVHKDWRIWDSSGLVSWQVGQDGITVFQLNCAIYKEGFAVENVLQTIFELRPGRPYPKGRTVTIPLPRPEQAAVREAHRLSQAATSAAKQEEQQSTVIWQAPPETSVQQAEEAQQEESAPAKKESRWRRFWRKVLRR